MSESSRVVLITGAASGIGYAFAEHLARGGWRVVISDLRGAEAAALRLQAAGAEAIGITADVVDEAQMATAVAAAVSRFGGLDALVNNAAIFTTLKLKPFMEISQAEWAQVMAVNAMGPFVCAKAAVPAMRQRGGGRIVNIASTVAVKGTVNMLHYVASKGALVSMTRSM
ncbi:MAG: SDR family oxidoreductase, partial [Burkholderiaceae bacterium]|nr:SDR family oxidoreductase [Burkholderiaceae bacterium]